MKMQNWHFCSTKKWRIAFSELQTIRVALDVAEKIVLHSATSCSFYHFIVILILKKSRQLFFFFFLSFIFLAIGSSFCHATFQQSSSISPCALIDSTFNSGRITHTFSFDVFITHSSVTALRNFDNNFHELYDLNQLK